MDESKKRSAGRWLAPAFGLPLLVLAAWAPAQASEWWVTGIGKTSDIFIDRGSITKVRVGGKSYLSAVEWRLDKAATTDPAKSARTLFYYDCTRNADALKSSTRYGIKGEVIESSKYADKDLEWVVETQGTIAYAGLNFVCDVGLIQPKATGFTSNGNQYQRVPDPEALVASVRTPKK